MPTITVRFFGPARDLVGEESVALEIDAGETVGRVAGRLSQRYPRLGAGLGIRLAVNRAYVALDHVLCDGDEVAVIPPVSGGMERRRARLTREPIDIGSLVADLNRPEAGAVVVFVGTVRSQSQANQTLTALDYRAYEEMALAQLQAIRSRAIETFDILDAAIVHRLGRLGPQDATIGIVVASAHRAGGFDACRWIIDRVKTDVAVWKKEVWADGTETWVDPTTP